MPRAVCPSEKLTVPVGVPAPGATGDTVAVTTAPAWPNVMFTGELDTVVVVDAWVTFIANGADVLAEKFAAPE